MKASKQYVEHIFNQVLKENQKIECNGWNTFHSANRFKLWLLHRYWDLYDFFHPYIVVKISTEKDNTLTVNYLNYISENEVVYTGLWRKARRMTKEQAITFKKLQGGVDDSFILFVKYRDYHLNYGEKDSFEELFIKTMKKEYIKCKKRWNIK